MKAVNGYLNNGRFTPLDAINLPRRVKAILVYNDTSSDEDQIDKMVLTEDVNFLSFEINGEEKKRRIAWLNKLDEVINLSMNEDLPDLVRSVTMRGPLNLVD